MKGGFFFFKYTKRIENMKLSPARGSNHKVHKLCVTMLSICFPRVGNSVAFNTLIFDSLLTKVFTTS